jgi:hypothetical protein
MYSADGLKSLGTTFHNVGLKGEKRDRTAMITMITSTLKLKVKR